MSILFVLLTFLVVIAFNYFYFHEPLRAPVEARAPVRLRPPVVTMETGLAIPQGYSFHPGHTWVVREAKDDARVGLDKFAVDLIGEIERIEVVDPSHWIRQGQRLATIHCAGESFDILSPVEGVVMAVNDDVVKNPTVAASDPYMNGWIAVLRSPDLRTNQRNLLQGPMVGPWMQYSVSRLKAALATSNPTMAQDGGAPVSNVLHNIEPKLRRKLIKEFFLS